MVKKIVKHSKNPHSKNPHSRHMQNQKQGTHHKKVSQKVSHQTHRAHLEHPEYQKHRKTQNHSKSKKVSRPVKNRKQQPRKQSSSNSYQKDDYESDIDEFDDADFDSEIDDRADLEDGIAEDGDDDDIIDDDDDINADIDAEIDENVDETELDRRKAINDKNFIRLKDKIMKWLDNDDKIKELNLVLKKYKQAKKEQEEFIIDMITRMGVDDRKIDVHNDDNQLRGRVYRHKSVTKGAIKEDIIKKALMEAIQDETKVNQLVKKIESKRPINERYYLKRTKGNKDGE